jgi:hypothetical protein
MSVGGRQVIIGLLIPLALLTAGRMAPMTVNLVTIVRGHLAASQRPMSLGGLAAANLNIVVSFCCE